MVKNPKYMFYRDLIISTKCGNYKGKISIAKPVFLISLIDAINERIFLNNRLYFGNTKFEQIYDRNSNTFYNKTLIMLPFYHLDTSDYYNIKWKKKYAGFSHTPSHKYMFDNIEYAYLDNALWDLLQDKDVREELREDIIKFFMLHPQNL